VPRRPTRTVPVVLLHGWEGSGPDHWQTWLANELVTSGRDVRYPDLPNAELPDLADWLAALHETLTGLPDDGFDVVCHSLASVLWLHHAANPGPTPRPARVVLVSPPSPLTTIAQIAEFFPPPLTIDAVRQAADGTVLVGSDDDPYCPEGIAEAYGRPLKIATTVIAGGGHLNSDSGFGPWPAILDWCGRDNLAFF
jgi:predicted alpha/beta hydrolase family esterase